MKKVFLKGIAIAMTAALLTAATGCAGENGPADPSSALPPSAGSSAKAADPGESAELRISWWGSQSRHDATLAALDVYMAQNPNVTVTPEYQGWDGYHDKLVTQIASSVEPDVIQFDNYRYIADFALSGKLMDLAPYVGGAIDLSAFPKDALVWGQYKGVQYGVPSGMNGTVCMYNKAIFDKANLDYPTDDWTMEQFEEICKKIHAALPDVYGVKEADWYLTSIIIRQNGKLLADKDSKLQDFSAETAVAFKMFNEWRENGIMPPLEVSSAKNTQQDNLFLSGQAAMNFKSIAQLPMDQSGMKDGDELGVAMAPGSKEHPSVFMEGAMPWTIGIHSKHKEEAAKLINFLSNDTAAAEKLMTVRGVPCSQTARDHITKILTPVDKLVFGGVDTLLEFGKEMDYYWTVPGNTQIGVILDEEKDNTGYGSKTPEQAAKDAYDRIVQAVAESSK